MEESRTIEMSPAVHGCVFLRRLEEFELYSLQRITRKEDIPKSGVITFSSTVFKIVDLELFLAWRHSRGEGIPVYSIAEPKRQKQSEPTIAEEAHNIIYGDRESTYGEPDKNLKVIAGLWSAYLGTEITATQVCDLMVLLKVARLKNSPGHRDSKVDIVGYTLLKDRIAGVKVNKGLEHVERGSDDVEHRTQ